MGCTASSNKDSGVAEKNSSRPADSKQTVITPNAVLNRDKDTSKPETKTEPQADKAEDLVVDPDSGMSKKEEKILDEVMTIEGQLRDLERSNDQFIKEESVKLMAMEMAIADAANEEMLLEQEASEALEKQAAAEEEEQRLRDEEEITMAKLKAAEDEQARLESLRNKEMNEKQRKDLEASIAAAKAQAAEQERILQEEERLRKQAEENAKAAAEAAAEATKLAELAAAEELKREQELAAELKRANEEEATRIAKTRALEEEEAKKLDALRQEEDRITATTASETANAPAPEPVAEEPKGPPPLKLGFINKCGQTVKSWNVRYFVLDNGKLAYYEKPANVPPYGINEKGKIPSLKGKTISKKGELVVLEGGDERDITLKFDSQATMQEWMSAIQSHIDYCNK